MIEQDNLGNSDSAESRGLQGQLPESLRGDLWRHWILVTVLGATGGGAAIQIVGKRNFDFAWLVGLGIFGFTTGLAQSLILGQGICQSDRSVRTAIQWTLTSLIGWGGGGMAGRIVTLLIALFLMFTINADYTWVYRFGEPVFWTSFVFLGTIAVSTFQQHILRTRIDPTVRWTWTSIIGWTVSWAVGLGIAHITPGSDWVKGAVGGAAGGVIVGAITGWALVRLLAGSSRGGEDSL